MPKRRGHPGFQIKALFIEHYLECFDAGKACDLAGYGRWYFPEELPRVGRALLRQPAVRKIVEKRLTDKLSVLGLNKGRILLEMLRIALADPRKFFDPTGRPLPINELDDDTAAALAGIEVERSTERDRSSGEAITVEHQTKKYKLISKDKTLELLYKHLHPAGDTGQKDRLEEIVRAMQQPVADTPPASAAPKRMEESN